MNYNDSTSTSSILTSFTETTIFNSQNISTSPPEAVLIAFQIGRTISIFCIIFGIFGNMILILTIIYSSFCHFPYGLIFIFLSIFDIIRLLSASYYYLIQANIINLTIKNSMIYIIFYRYSKIITNWLKVFLAIERLIAVKYWIKRRYNIYSNNSKKINNLRQKKLFLLIILLFICSLISQHPNLILNRFISIHIDPIRLLIINTPNPYYYYGKTIFNGILYIIISYIILDDLLPISILFICNTILLYELRHLPKLTSKKLSESIFILFFLTIFSIFILPRSFLVFFNLYANQEYINNTIFAIIFHTVQGLEMINHAITGYACFLTSQTLRKDFIRNFREIISKFRRKTYQIKSSIIELPTLA